MPNYVKEELKTINEIANNDKKEGYNLLLMNESEKRIVNKLMERFDDYRNRRDQRFSFFRGRTLTEYIDDSNKRFNNYRIMESWKDEWQSNMSDPTTHSKVLAIVAHIVSNRLKPNFVPRFQRDIISYLKASIIGDLFNYTDTEMRNGDIDLVFTLLRAAREGTVIGFEGWKKGINYEGIDAQFVPLEDFYPDNVSTFFMEDIHRCFWRSKVPYTVFLDKYKNFYNFEKVKSTGEIRTMEEPIFKVSGDIRDDEVEVIRYFDNISDEFYIIANGVLITKPGSKLSTRRKDKKLGFWKGIYEPYDDKFFYGRSLPDVIADDQDAIDGLFNAMFDKEILSVLRPLLIGGQNDLAEDYFYPGAIKNVKDVTQIKELEYSGPDLNAFRILKELKDRQSFATTDPVSQGVTLGARTATEIERAQENARKIFGLFDLLIRHAILQKAKLRVATIQQYMIGKEEYREFVFENALLTERRFGTRILRIKKTRKELTPANEFRFSKLLAMENAIINGESEIIEILEDEIKNFDVNVKIELSSPVELSPALRKAFIDRFTTKAYAMPHIFDPKVVAEIDIEANKDVLGSWADRLLLTQNPQEQQLQQPQLNQSELTNELLPTSKAAVPNLKSLINNPL